MAPCLFAKGSSGVPKMISLPLRLPGETQVVVLSAASQRRSPCCPRVRDRVGQGSERIRFSPAILPPYARWSAGTYAYTMDA
jgi:hypothetical protein